MGKQENVAYHLRYEMTVLKSVIIECTIKPHEHGHGHGDNKVSTTPSEQDNCPPASGKKLKPTTINGKPKTTIANSVIAENPCKKI